MNYVLHESGMYSTLQEVLTSGRPVSDGADAEEERRRVSRYRHECAWRLARWDEGEDDDAPPDRADDPALSYMRSRSLALRHLVTDDGDAEKCEAAVSGARRALCRALRGGEAVESATRTCTVLGQFRALRELERLASLARDPTEEALRQALEEWKERDESEASFDHVEETLLQRYDKLLDLFFSSNVSFLPKVLLLCCSPPGVFFLRCSTSRPWPPPPPPSRPPSRGLAPRSRRPRRTSGGVAKRGGTRLPSEDWRSWTEGCRCRRQRSSGDTRG